MEKMKFDIGYNIEVDSLHCKNCEFNVTDDKKLNEALSELRKKMSKDIKLIRIGEGLGIRLPNDIVKSYNLKKGRIVSLTSEEDGLKIVI
ncbi:MAG: AbrB/MazE/SpoVT family DNA-binding domain-containing protein [archaeon]